MIENAFLISKDVNKVIEQHKKILPLLFSRNRKLEACFYVDDADQTGSVLTCSGNIVSGNVTV